jgi:hypothetical protein
MGTGSFARRQALYRGSRRYITRKSSIVGSRWWWRSKHDGGLSWWWCFDFVLAVSTSTVTVKGIMESSIGLKVKRSRTIALILSSERWGNAKCRQNRKTVLAVHATRGSFATSQQFLIYVETPAGQGVNCGSVHHQDERILAVFVVGNVPATNERSGGMIQSYGNTTIVCISPLGFGRRLDHRVEWTKCLLRKIEDNMVSSVFCVNMLSIRNRYNPQNYKKMTVETSTSNSVGRSNEPRIDK